MNCSTNPTIRSRGFVIGIAAACLFAAAAAAAICWFKVGDANVAETADAGIDRAQGTRPLSVVVSGDTAGWIVPCECTSNQSGGLPRRATFLDSLRKTGDVIVADAGGAAGGVALYERLKFEAILKGELAMGLVAHNLGASEARLGADYLRRTAADLNVPFVSANVRDAGGNRLVDAYRIVDVAGRRIAFVGVLSQKFAVDGLHLDDPTQAVLSALTEIRQHGHDFLVVLAYLPADELRSLAAGLPEADVVVGGPTGQAVAPVAVGPGMMAAATNKGKFVVRFSVPPPNVSPAESAKLSGEIVELNDRFADHPKQKENVAAFYAALAKQDVSADQTGLVPTLATEVPADYRVAGSAACSRCHEDDYHRWNDSTHAHAWDTLTTRGAHVDSFCQQCHTTGFGSPGGFQSAKRSGDMVNVVCESCHGPSSAHAMRSDKRTPFVARDQCTRCHDHENSPEFEFASYWERIEHGPAAKAHDAHTPISQEKSEARP